MIQNRKGITIVEVLTAAVLSIVIITAFTAVGQQGIKSSFVTNRRAYAAMGYNNALQRITSDIRASYEQGVTLPADKCDGNGKNCSEITLKVPIIDGTDVAGTQYTTDGRIKYGADGSQNCLYKYRVDSATKRLIRETVCDTTCDSNSCNSDPACNPEAGENATNCPIQCPAGCGDGPCTPPETCENCPTDCGGICCPDGYCNFGETCQTCSADCGACENISQATCGANGCEAGETCLTCPGDCGSCDAIPFCGDGACNSNIGETCIGPGGSTPNGCVDCGNCCGGIGHESCESEYGEDCQTCEYDCGACCGNGVCESQYDETCSTCSNDCGACCGNGVCEPQLGENSLNCPAASGGDCPIACGDFYCHSGTETCSSCPGDCGSCAPPPCIFCGKGKTCANCAACCGGGVN